MWLALEERKVELAGCKGSLLACQSQMESVQGELADATAMISSLKANVGAIKQQVAKWQKIAADAEAYAKRLLEAAEAKVECEVYHEGNARLVDEFVDTFNNSVRRKILRPADTGDSGSGKVVPKAPSTDSSKSDK